MKTMDINENLKLELDDRTERYVVSIDSLTYRVQDWVSDFSPIGIDGIQKLVDKLIRLGMITVDKNISTEDGDVEVSIVIWNIDETDDLYIETYHTNPHIPDNESFDDYDMVMEYEEFLNS